MARQIHHVTAAFAGLLVVILFAGVTRAQSSAPACNTDGTSGNIVFSTSGSNRVITTNMCPNHPIRTINPNAAREVRYWGSSSNSYNVPLAPTLAPSAQIINVTCMGGGIGIARSGGVFYSVFPGTCGSDAVKLEGSTFDECGGHSDQSGQYHYHLTPTCTLTSAGATSGQHSPILGYLVDGIPVYGPLGANGLVPTDLDSCGGHSSDGGNNGNYHYHMKPITGSWPDPATPLTSTSSVGAGWPYTPGCLRGCVPDTYLNFWVGRGTTLPQTSYSSCVSAGTAQPQAESIGATTGSSTAATTPAPTSTTLAPTTTPTATTPAAAPTTSTTAPPTPTPTPTTQSPPATTTRAPTPSAGTTQPATSTAAVGATSAPSASLASTPSPSASSSSALRAFNVAVGTILMLSCVLSM